MRGGVPVFIRPDSNPSLISCSVIPVAAKMEELEHYVIREKLDYLTIPALSNEAREKLLRVQPETIGQASRISGVSPADISILMVYLGK